MIQKSVQFFEYRDENNEVKTFEVRFAYNDEKPICKENWFCVNTELRDGLGVVKQTWYDTLEKLPAEHVVYAKSKSGFSDLDWGLANGKLPDLLTFDGAFQMIVMTARTSALGFKVANEFARQCFEVSTYGFSATCSKEDLMIDLLLNDPDPIQQALGRKWQKDRQDKKVFERRAIEYEKKYGLAHEEIERIRELWKDDEEDGLVTFEQLAKSLPAYNVSNRDLHALAEKDGAIYSRGRGSKKWFFKTKRDPRFGYDKNHGLRLTLDGCLYVMNLVKKTYLF